MPLYEILKLNKRILEYHIFMQMKSCIILIFTILLSCSSSTNDNQTCNFDLSSEFISDQLRFSISYPKDFVISEDEIALSLAAVKPTEDSTYLEAFGITVEQNVLHYKLDEFYRVSVTNDKDEYALSSSDFKIEDQGSEIINNHAAKWNIYSYNDEVALNYFFTYKEKTYRIIFLSYSHNSDSLSCKFKQIIKSINFR